MTSVDVCTEFCLLNVMLMQLVRKPVSSFKKKKKKVWSCHIFINFPVLHSEAELEISLLFEDESSNLESNYTA